MKKGAIIVARHGERIDYYLRDGGSNWLQTATATRPFDPPLTRRGQMQGRRLGMYLADIIETHNLPPMEAVYSSPMVRCCMTAAEAVKGYEEEVGKKQQQGNNDDGNDTEKNLKVSVENGLVESLNRNWYASWCLKTSNGTWGGPNGFDTKYEDPDLLHGMDSRANDDAHVLLQDGSNVSKFLSSYDGNDSDKSLVSTPYEDDFCPMQLSSLVNRDGHRDEMVSPMQDAKFKWNNFETKKGQQDRMQNVVAEISKRHPNGTILLVSHGGPVTHLFERLMNDSWETFGVSTYTSFTVYQDESCVEDEKCDEKRWKALVVNDDSHVKAMKMESSDHAGSFA
jgi:broad specificity phosphatase PhoE